MLSPVHAITLTIDTEIPEFVLSDTLNLSGSLETTFESIKYEGAKWWNSGTYDNLTIIDNGELWLIPDFNITMLNGEKAVLSGGTGWDALLMSNHIMKHNGTYFLYYTGSANSSGGDPQIGLATSNDGISYTKYSGNPIIKRGPGSFDKEGAQRPIVLMDNGTWRMWYAGAPVNESYDICYATSPDGFNWTKQSVNPVIERYPFNNSWYYEQLRPVGILKNSDNSYDLYVEGYTFEWHLGKFHSANGTIWPNGPDHLRVAQDNNWEQSVANFQTVEEGHGTYRIWSYCGQGTRRLGYSWSKHGNSWPDSVGPIISPTNRTIYSKNLEGPTAVDEGDHYYMVMKCSDGTTNRYGAWRMYPQKMNATFTSQVHTLKSVARLAGIDWDDGRPAGGDLDLFLRCGNTTDNLSEWYGFDYEHRPVNITAKHFQFKAVFSAPEDWYRIGLRFFEIKVQAFVANVSVRVDDGPWKDTGWNNTNWWVDLKIEDGDHNITVMAKDLFGNEVNQTLPVKVDLYPPTGEIVIEGEANYTSSLELEYSLTANDSRGVPFCRVSLLPDLSDASWTEFYSVGSWDFSGLDGNVTLYAQFKDGAGRISEVMNDTIFVDTTLPEGRVSINRGARYTNNTEVSLFITWEDASGVTGIQVSNDQSFSGVPWMDPIHDLKFDLLSGDGERTVFVRLRDAAGWTSIVWDSIILDTSPPIASVSIDGDELYCAEREVNLEFHIFDENPVTVTWSNDVGMESSGSAIIDSTYHLEVWVLLSGPDGLRTVYFEASDAAGNTANGSDSIVLDNTPPDVKLSIENGSLITSSPLVTCQLNASDATSGLARMRASNLEDLSDGGWQVVRESFQWLLIPGDGVRTIHVQVRDLAGHVSTVSASIILDATPPEGQMLINNGDKYATESEVFVRFIVSGMIPDVDAMRVSASSDLEDVEWRTFQEEIAWTLPSGDGEKTLYAELRDLAGNTIYLMDTIVLDTETPTGWLRLSGGDKFTNSTDVKVNLFATDWTSGIDGLALSRTGDPSGSDMVPYYDEFDWVIEGDDGVKIVYLIIFDRAGWTTVISDTIILDTMPPMAGIEIEGGTVYVNHIRVMTNLWATDDGSGIRGMQYIEGGLPLEGIVPFRESIQWRLEEGDGTKRITVWIWDNSGLFIEVTDIIILDTNPPTVGFSHSDYLRFDNSQATLTPTWADNLDPSPTIEYRVDGGAWHPLEGVQLAVSVSVGRHTVEVRATDAAGNSHSSEVVVVRVEKWFSTSGNLLLLLLVIVGVFLAAIVMNKRRRHDD